MKNLLKTWLCLAVFFYLPFASADRPNLGLFLIMHDQLTQQEEAELGDGYLNHLLAQMEEITGRRTTVIRVKDVPGLTDFAYRGDDMDGLSLKLFLASRNYADEKNLPRPSARHKYVFLTSNKIRPTTHGFAAKHYNVAIASLKNYNTLAHEIGHLFGATHEAATGFPCQTTMWEDFSTSIIPCYYFSEANRDLIRNYVDNIPSIN
ncbi:hypothetical protein K0038_05109 [Pseudomonas syringae]|uniref:reprolysin-like metallopeptidase n=1 Tax=Pseudomonas syringae TaxID=317 RepID=UPI001CA9C8E9|nr:hypothetical protein [Pseudomonas syringae]MCI3947993.1 hypothetical protein [Pseudomonas syringae]